MLPFFLMILGMISRFIIHVPNFTPVVSMALFSGATFPKRYATIVPLALMIISDIFIGFHSTILFTWSSIAVISLFGMFLRRNSSWAGILGVNLWSAIFFFTVTNFGTWLWEPNLYPHTMEGLKQCFIMAIPFFRSTLISTLLYSAVLFGANEFVGALARTKRWARVLVPITK